MNTDKFEVYRYFCGIRDGIIPAGVAPFVKSLCYDVHCGSCRHNHNDRVTKCSVYNIKISTQEINQFNSQLKLTNPEYFI